MGRINSLRVEREGMSQALSYEMRIEYPSAEWAEYVRNALKVDKELRSQIIKKELLCDGNVLVIKLSSSEENVKILRTSASSIFDMVHLATRTLNAFGS